VETVSDDDPSHYFGSDPSISLDKSTDPQTYLAVGDEITYTFDVTNTGNVILTNVTVIDLLPGLSQITPASVDTLAPETTATFTATYTITQNDMNDG